MTIQKYFLINEILYLYPDIERSVAYLVSHLELHLSVSCLQCYPLHKCCCNIAWDNRVDTLEQTSPNRRHSSCSSAAIAPFASTTLRLVFVCRNDHPPYSFTHPHLEGAIIFSRNTTQCHVQTRQTTFHQLLGPSRYFSRPRQQSRTHNRVFSTSCWSSRTGTHHKYSRMHLFMQSMRGERGR